GQTVIFNSPTPIDWSSVQILVNGASVPARSPNVVQLSSASLGVGNLIQDGMNEVEIYAKATNGLPITGTSIPIWAGLKDHVVKILDGSGNPLPNVDVVIRLEGTELTEHCVTDSAGDVVFDSLPFRHSFWAEATTPTGKLSGNFAAGLGNGTG